ncbi:MAG: arsenate reductase ArsC, partial [Chloroflexi bacterium]|nr:arsenate reductase ArsC [Chloroflexota bacterium]
MLFICVGNAGRSQMAEAFFNHLARGKVQATSAGTNP